MIQRVQSIWLLLTSLTLFLLLLLPIVNKHWNGNEYALLVTGLYVKTKDVSSRINNFLPLFVTTIVISFISLINIFNFKNRKSQKTVAIVVIVLIAGLSFWVSQVAREIPGGTAGATFGIGAFLPILAIIWCFLAIRGIKKDEQLLRSADRLR
jgi:hypothetical protein